MKRSASPRKTAAILLSLCLILCILASLAPARAADESEAADSLSVQAAADAFQEFFGQVKDLDLQKLLRSEEIRQVLQSIDPSKASELIKSVLAQSAGMSDDELRSLIRTTAEENSVRLTDTQVEQLLSLCRTAEKLDEIDLEKALQSLQEVLKKLQSTGKKVQDMGEKASEALEGIQSVSGKAKGFWGKVTQFFSGLLGRR